MSSFLLVCHICRFWLIVNARIKINLKSCIMDLSVFWGIFRLRSDNDAFGKRAVGMKALIRAGNQTQCRPEYFISVWPNLETQGKVLWFWQDLTIDLKRDAGRFISTPQRCLWNITVLVKANLRTPKNESDYPLSGFQQSRVFSQMSP